MRVATDPTYTATVGAAGATALAMLMLDLQHYGYAIAGIFFGLWLVPLGYLTFKSGMFPKVLGIVLVVGGIGYLFDTLAAFVAPELTPIIHPIAALLGIVAEVSLLAYLLVKGVRESTPVGSAVLGSPDTAAGDCVGRRGRIHAPPSRQRLAATDLHRFNTTSSPPTKESIAMIQSPTMIAKTVFTTSERTDGTDPAWTRPWLRAEGLATFAAGLAGFLSLGLPWWAFALS